MTWDREEQLTNGSKFRERRAAAKLLRLVTVSPFVITRSVDDRFLELLERLVDMDVPCGIDYRSMGMDSDVSDANESIIKMADDEKAARCRFQTDWLNVPTGRGRPVRPSLLETTNTVWFIPAPVHGMLPE